MSGRWGGRGRKMGYEGGSSSRRPPSDRVTVAGVEFRVNPIAGTATCSLCRQFGASAATDRWMLAHAQTHRPEEVARVAALAKLTAALEQLDAAQLAAVAEVLPAVVANPVGFAVVVHALTSGAGKHPGRGLGPSPDQLVVDHLGALDRHADRAWEARDSDTAATALTIDADTGLPHAGLAAARGVLAIQRANEDRRRG